MKLRDVSTVSARTVRGSRKVAAGTRTAQRQESPRVGRQPCARLLSGNLSRVLSHLLKVADSDDATPHGEPINFARRDARAHARRETKPADFLQTYQTLRECAFLCLQEQLAARKDLSTDTHSRALARVGTVFDAIMREAFEAYNAEHLKNLRRLSCTDSLTTLYNHRTFYERLEEELRRAARYDSQLSIAIIDLDNFKGVNDSLGHQQGDLLLTGCADLLRRELRRTDIVCRYGGDEFSIILPNTKAKSACRILNRLPELFVQLGKSLGTPADFGMSCGIASFPEDGETAMTLVQRADALLLNNKSLRLETIEELIKRHRA